MSFHAYTSHCSILNTNLSRYISVLGGSQESSGWTYRLFGYLLSHQEPSVPKENCTQLPLFYFASLNGTGECRRTTQNYTHALSPAFLIEGKGCAFLETASP